MSKYQFLKNEEDEKELDWEEFKNRPLQNQLKEENINNSEQINIENLNYNPPPSNVPTIDKEQLINEINNQGIESVFDNNSITIDDLINNNVNLREININSLTPQIMRKITNGELSLMKKIGLDYTIINSNKISLNSIAEIFNENVVQTGLILGLNISEIYQNQIPENEINYYYGQSLDFVIHLTKFYSSPDILFHNLYSLPTFTNIKLNEDQFNQFKNHISKKFNDFQIQRLKNVFLK